MAARKAVGALTRSACSPPEKCRVGETGSVHPVTKSAFSAQSPDMEWHPDDQPQQDDRRGDLNPDQSSQLS
jgi:hypothetical protein